MGKPRRHHTKSRTNMSRSHIALKPMEFIICTHCKTQIRPHRVCPNCGYYKGEEVVNVLKDLKKKK